MTTAHILVVDDEPEIANSLAEYLTNQGGYQVTRASDGQEALSLLEVAPSGTPGPFDLVVLDRRMPRLSGLEVLERIRQHPELKYTRIVMLTGASGHHEKVEALSAGADDYITKPYYPQELLARVETILRTQRLEKQLQRQSQQLASLNRISNAITTTLDINHIPTAAVKGSRTVLGVEMAAIFLRDQGGSHLSCRAAIGPGGGHLEVEQFAPVRPESGILGRAYTSSESQLVNEPAANRDFSPGVDSPPQLKLRNLLAMPLIVRSRAAGLLVAYNKIDGPFSEVDAGLFASLASAVSRALENASLFKNVKARQQELQESHDRLQAVMNGILHPIYTIDDNWQLVAVNQEKASSLDTVPDQLVGQICYRVFFNRDQPCAHCQVADVLATKEPANWAVRWAGADHLPQEWDVHAYPLPGTHPSAPSAVVIWQDRTEERRLEHTLMQAGKLTAIGQLAAGVAHEINNPLTAINANAQMLKMVIPADDDMFEAVDLIARAGDRATNVVRGLLDFARQNQYSFEAGNVNLSIQQALRLVSYQLRVADIQVVRHLDEQLPDIEASWEHIKTVWLNLLINARDALMHRPENRQIEIETRLAAAGDHVQILLTDNGAGITDAEAVHIFEPFYTTKAPGQGTGLGLATSQRVVHQHGGTIELLSESGQGTTFIVRLPLQQSNSYQRTMDTEYGSTGK